PGNSSLFSFEQTTHRSLDGADLDGEIVRVVRETLSADVPGATFVSVDEPHDKLLSTARQIYRTDEGAINAVRTELKPWRNSHPVDSVVLLLPMQSSLENHAQWRMFYGMGVSWNEGVVLMQVVILDGKTGEVLRTEKSRAIAPLGFRATSETFLDPSP